MHPNVGASYSAHTWGCGRAEEVLAADGGCDSGRPSERRAHAEAAPIFFSLKKMGFPMATGMPFRAVPGVGPQTHTECVSARLLLR